jgi:multiple sugar transport system permease protein
MAMGAKVRGFLRDLRNPRVRAGYFFVSPFMIYFIAFLLVPIVASVLISFTKYNVFDPPEWVGLKNYARIFFGREVELGRLFDALIREKGTRDTVLFYKSLKNTLAYAIGSVGGGVLLSLTVAIIFDEKWFRGRSFFRTVYFLPTITPMAAIAFIWILLFSPRTGLINYLLVRVGVAPQSWLGDPRTAMLSLVLVSIWKGLGYNIVIFLAGLQGIPTEYYDAARVDGASRLAEIRHITVPLLMPVVAFVTVTGVIGSFQVFDLVYFMTKGGPLNATEVIVHLIYENGFQPPEFKMGYASALAIVLFGVIFIFTVLQFRFFRRRQTW